MTTEIHAAAFVRCFGTCVYVRPPGSATVCIYCSGPETPEEAAAHNLHFWPGSRQVAEWMLPFVDWKHRHSQRPEDRAPLPQMGGIA